MHGMEHFLYYFVYPVHPHSVPILKEDRYDAR